jgi:hypothetical protein
MKDSLMKTSPTPKIVRYRILPPAEKTTTEKEHVGQTSSLEAKDHDGQIESDGTIVYNDLWLRPRCPK